MYKSLTKRKKKKWCENIFFFLTVKLRMEGGIEVNHLTPPPSRRLLINEKYGFSKRIILL